MGLYESPIPQKIVGRAGYKSVADIVLWCIRSNMSRIDQVITEIEEADKDGEQDQQ